LGVPPDTAQWIEPSTLRWHLQRVFAKTGTARQAELARLVTRVGAVTREV
jgi:DNA-binding CsgD family transcriptional regulator